MEKEKIGEKNGFSVFLVREEYPADPRKEFDGMGKMVCWHRRYDLGDEHDFKSPDDFLDWWKENGEGGVLLSLYLYDHSGITMSVKPFSCPWDSGQVGWIYATAEMIEHEYDTSDDPKLGSPKERAEKYLKGEVEEYDKYLTGDVWGYIIEGPDGEIDSCFGYYGYEYAKDDALSELKSLVADADKDEKRVLDFIAAH